MYSKCATQSKNANDMREMQIPDRLSLWRTNTFGPQSLTKNFFNKYWFCRGKSSAKKDGQFFRTSFLSHQKLNDQNMEVCVV